MGGMLSNFANYILNYKTDMEGFCFMPKLFY